LRIRISLIRFLLEAGFIILVATAAGLARLSALWIGVVMFGAWLLVAFVERTGARGVRRRLARIPWRRPVGVRGCAGREYIGRFVRSPSMRRVSRPAGWFPAQRDETDVRIRGPWPAATPGRISRIRPRGGPRRTP
jgi:hypothetical protein